jgi:hypothetical protein
MPLVYGDWDNDLYPAAHEYSMGQEEANGVVGVAIYDPASLSGPYAQTSGSPGFNAGVEIPGISSVYSGNSPDIGVQEAGLSALVFGRTA